MAKELSRVRPPRRHRGLVVFFTGYSGSGKSTIARGLADSLRESGERKPFRTLEVPTELVLRRSCAPPPATGA